jgi:hypothetical protein
MPSKQALATCPRTVGEPIPGADAVDIDDQILPIGRNGLEKRPLSYLHVPVHKALSIMVQDADAHGAGMPAMAASVRSCLAAAYAV